ncbi:FAD-binding oxidoreductase [Chloroflexota bacterium]
MSHTLYPGLCEIVGVKYVADSEYAVWAYSKDSSGFPARVPGIVVRPESTEEVSQIVKLANRERVPIIPRGGGCQYGGWPPGEPGKTICIDLTRMRNVIEVNEVNKTVRVEAGITGTELETRMREKGFCVHTVQSPSDSVTVGGFICGESGGGGGAESSALGPNWPFVLGVKAVLPNGDIVETGTRTNSRAKIYSRLGHGPDLTGLFIGSMGIFGIVTEATFRISALRPHYDAGSVTFEYDKLEDAHRAMTQLSSCEPKVCASIILVGPGPASPKEQDWGLVYMATGYTQDEVDKKLEAAYGIINEVAPNNKGPSKRSERISRAYITQVHDSPHNLGMWFFIEFLCPRDESLEVFKETFASLKEGLSGWENRVRLYQSSLYAVGDDDYVSYGGFFDLTDTEARDRALGAWKETVDMVMGMGMNLVILNKDLGDVCARYFPPAYHSLLRTLKSALDPNNIMNPHMLLLP